MNLNNISTQALIDELSKRKEVKKLAVGPWKDHRLTTKYEQNGSREISSETVLVFNPTYL